MKYNNGKYIGKSLGYGGEIELEVEIIDNKINNIDVIKHSETKVISDPAFKYVLANIKEENTILVPNVSGCSITSRALREAVKNTLVKAGANESALKLVFGKIAGESVVKNK